MVEKILKGAKGGGSSSSGSFTQTPDNLRSDDTFEGVLGMGIGPFKGPVNGLKGVKVNGTAVENATGQRNFGDFVVVIGNGDPAAFPQKVQLKLGSGAAPTQVGLELTNPAPSTVPGPWITKTLTNTGADFIDLRFIVNQLYKQTDKGIFTNTATIEIQMKPTGMLTWIDPTLGGIPAAQRYTKPVRTNLDYYEGTSTDYYGVNNPAPSTGFVITGKTTSASVHELRIDVPNTGSYAGVQWDVRCRQREVATVDSADGKDVQRRNITWESIAGVYSSVLGEHEDWRGVAWMQVYGKASSQLTGVPEMTGEWDTKIVSVPPASVYNPTTRQYTGAIWDGSWAKAFTNDPAWVVNDAISDSLSGLALIAQGSYLNKWDALDASKWASQLVPDGAGGTHPRYSINISVAEPQKAEEFIRYMAGAMGGLAWDQGDGEWRMRVDKPETPVDIFTLETIEGEFTYSHTDVDTRFNDITMAFKNKSMDYREDRVRLFDNAHIARFGRKPTTMVAVGCTNRQEAMRRTKLRLETTTKETRLVNFVTNRRGRNVNPLDVILVADGDLGSLDNRSTGRTLSVSADRLTITLRDTVRLEIGVAYTLNFSSINPNYNPAATTQPTNATWKMPTIAQTRTVTNGAGARGNVTVLTLDTALPADIPANLSVSLSATNLTTLPKMYRVLNVNVDETGERIGISALEVNTAKWDASDNVTNQDTIFQDIRGVVSPPTNPVINLIRVPTQAGGDIVTMMGHFQRPGDAFISGFEVTYKINGGPRTLLADKITQPNFEIVNPSPGTYTFEIKSFNRKGQTSRPLVATAVVTRELLDAAGFSYADGRTGQAMMPADAGATLGASWPTNVSSRPTNLAALTGTEGVNNQLVTIGASGALGGAGTGQVTIGGLTPNGVDDLSDGVTYKRFAGNERTKLSGVETGATLGSDWALNTRNRPTNLAGIVGTEDINNFDMSTDFDEGGTLGRARHRFKSKGIGFGSYTQMPNAVQNQSVTIGASGALGGAGTGQVTIGGLGYTGALDATYGASWGSNLTGRPTNVAALAGTEDINNFDLSTDFDTGGTAGRARNRFKSKGVGFGSYLQMPETVQNLGVTMGSNGALGGAGTGQVTIGGLTPNGVDDLADGTTYKRYQLTERTKLGGVETGATLGATWGSNIGSRPANLSALAGTEDVNNFDLSSDYDTAGTGGRARFRLKSKGVGVGTGYYQLPETIQNLGVTMGANGALGGAGTGQVTIGGLTPNGVDDLADGTTYKRYQLTERTKLGAVAAKATRNVDATNMIPSPLDFDNAAFQNGATLSVTAVANTRPLGYKRAVLSTPNAICIFEQSTTAIPVVPGDTLYFSYAVWHDLTGPTTDTVSGNIQWFGADGGFISGTGPASAIVSGNQLTAVNGPITAKGSATAPAGAAFTRLYVQRLQAAQPGYFIVAEPTLTRHELGATLGAAWNSNLSGRPANVAALGGSENINNSLVAIGVNQIVNSDFTHSGDFAYGWANSYADVVGTVERAVNNPSYSGQLNVAYARALNDTSTGKVFDGYENTPNTEASFLSNLKRWATPVYPGERIFISALVAVHRCLGMPLVAYFDGTGGFIGSDAPAAGGLASGAGGGDPNNFTRMGGFYTIPANARYASLRVRGATNGGTDPYVFYTQMMMCKVNADQTAWPAYNSGPADRHGTLGALWGSTLFQRPTNVAALTGNEGIQNSLVTIGANGALGGAGTGQVSLTGLGAGAFASYPGSVKAIVGQQSNLFPWPRGIRDGRTTAQIGWLNATPSNGFTGLNCGISNAGIGGGFYQQYRSAGGTACTLYPIFDYDPGLDVSGAPYSFSVNGYCSGAGNSFAPYIEFRDATNSNTLSFVYCTYNSNSSRWEASLAAAPTGTRYLRLVLRATFVASAAYQDVTFWGVKLECSDVVTPYIDYDNAKITGAQIQWSGGEAFDSLKPAERMSTLGAAWSTNLTLRPTNLAALAGTEGIQNTLVTIGNNGALGGAGTGQVTIGGLGYLGNLKATRNTDGANMIPSPIVYDQAEIASGAYLSDARVNGTGRQVLYGFRVVLPNSYSYVVFEASGTISVIPGETLFYSYALFQGGGLTTDTVYGYFEWRGADGAIISGSGPVSERTGNQLPAGNTFVIKDKIVVPAGAAFCRFYVQRNSGTQNGYFCVGEPYLGRHELGATYGADWTSGNLANRPANLAALGGTENINNSLVPVGQNQITNSDFSHSGDLAYGWIDAGFNNFAAPVPPVLQGVNLNSTYGGSAANVAYLNAQGNTSTNSSCDGYANTPNSDFKRWTMPVYDGDRIFISSLVAVHRCLAYVLCVFIDKNGAYLSEAGTNYGGTSGGATGGGDPSTMSRVGAFITVPANARFASLRMRMVTNGGTDPYVFYTQMMMCKVNADQTTWPPYNPGPADRHGTLGAAWGANLTGRPGNLSALAGSEGIQNTLVTIGNNGALGGAGTGQVTIGGLGYAGDLKATRNADGANMIPSPILLDQCELGGAGTYVNNNPGGSGGRQLSYKRIVLSVNQAYVMPEASVTRMPVVPGDTLYFSYGVGTDGSGPTSDSVIGVIQWFDNVGTYLSAYVDTATRITGNALPAPATVKSGAIPVPNNASFCRMYVQREAAVQAGYFLISEFYLGRSQQGANLVADVDAFTNKHKITVPGSGIRIGDQRNMPQMATQNLRYRFNTTISSSAPVTAAGAGTGTATLSVAAGTSYIGTSTIAYNAASVGVSGPASTAVTFYLYWDDPYFSGGAQTLYSTTDPNVIYNNDGRVYVGTMQVTFPAAGTTGSPPPPGGGGGGGCVHMDAWVLTDEGYLRAATVKPGMKVRVLTSDGEGTEWEEVTHNKIVPQPGYRLTSASGFTLALSDNTPLTLRDGSGVYPPDYAGQPLPVMQGDKLWWEPCVAEKIEDIYVSHISCHSRVYAAGDVVGRMILTHNIALKP